MSEMKKRIQDFKNFIDPYQKKLSDWYKNDKNAKKFIEVISPYKNKFFDFYKKNSRNKNIVRAGGVVLILILGKGLLGGGDNWSNKEKNNFKQDCIDSVGYKHLKNYSKYVKKFCDCGADYLSKQGKKNQITESDELAAVGFCQDYLRGENAVDAMEKDLRKNLKNIGY